MNCKSCGTENPEESIFCKECGRRVDGKTVCPACGASIPYDSKFCIICGTTVKQAPVQQEAAIAAAPIEQEAPAEEPVILPAETPQKAAFPWRRYVEIGGWVAALTGLFFTLLFTFFIGFHYTVEGYNASLGGHGIYYFFSQAYDEINATFLGTAGIEYLEFYKFSLYWPVVLGTVISASVLITVIVLSTVAVVRFVQTVRGIAVRDYIKPIFAAYFTFVIASLMIFGLYSANMSMESVGLRATLNSETTAGIALGGVFLFLYAACRVGVKGKEIVQKTTLIKCGYAAVCIVFGALVLAFLPKTAIRMTNPGGSEKAGASFTMLLQMLGMYYVSSEVKAAPATETALGIFAQLVQFALLIVVAAFLLRGLAGLWKEKKTNTLGLAIASLALGAAYLAFSIAFGKTAIDYMNSSSETALSYAAPIVVFVFTALLFAAALAENLLQKKFAPKEEFSV